MDPLRRELLPRRRCSVPSIPQPPTDGFWDERLREHIRKRSTRLLQRSTTWRDRAPDGCGGSAPFGPTPSRAGHSGRSSWLPGRGSRQRAALDVSPGALGGQRSEGPKKTRIIVVGRVNPHRSPPFRRTGDERTPPFAYEWQKSRIAASLKRYVVLGRACCRLWAGMSLTRIAGSTKMELHEQLYEITGGSLCTDVGTASIAALHRSERLPGRNLSEHRRAGGQAS